MDYDYASPGVVSVKGGKPTGKKVLESIDISPSKNDGFVAKCRYCTKTDNGQEVGPYLSPETYTFESKDSLIAFLTEKL